MGNLCFYISGLYFWGAIPRVLVALSSGDFSSSGRSLFAATPNSMHKPPKPPIGVRSTWPDTGPQASPEPNKACKAAADRTTHTISPIDADADHSISSPPASGKHDLPLFQVSHGAAHELFNC